LLGSRSLHRQSMNKPAIAGLFLLALSSSFFSPPLLSSPPQAKPSTAHPALIVEEAQRLAKIGDFPGAIAAYRQALLLAPRDEAAELGLAEAYRGVHNNEQASAAFAAARKHHPKNTSVLKALGSFEIEAETYDAAIEALQAAVELAPVDVSARNLLGTAYLSKGENEAALAQFVKALALDPANELARFMRAQTLADSGKNEDALADAEKAFAAKPDSLRTRMLLAKILIRLKQCPRAAETLHPAENPPALDTQALYLLANAYACAGQADLARGAREEFTSASEKERRQAENEIQSTHLYEHANELARQNKFPEALELLQQALEKNAKNAFAYAQQAKIFFSRHETEKAREAIARALAIQPYQPDFLYVEGVIAGSQGQDDEALAAFEKVTQINPKEADAYFEMGRIFAKRKDRAHALAAFRKALELAPDDADYKRALEAASSSAAPLP